MIRVATLDTFDPKQLEKLLKTLYQAFGVGAEHAGDVRFPSGLTEPYDSKALLAQVDPVRAYPDDKVLYLTLRKFKDREVPSGLVPTSGFGWFAKDRAVVSIHPAKDFETGYKLVARQSLHQLGHLWELHHCLDPRCAMYPPWTLNYDAGDTFFDTFCRDKSEQRIRLAKS